MPQTSHRTSSFLDRVAFWVATSGGAGLVPKAPGTAGSLVAIPWLLATVSWPMLWKLGVWILVTLIGIWSAKAYDASCSSQDNQKIVIDEVVGMYLTGWTCGANWISLTVAFIAFRFFDITKIPPVRNIDAWSKKMASGTDPRSQWWGGFGVVADDLLAGVQGTILIRILQSTGVIS